MKSTVKIGKTTYGFSHKTEEQGDFSRRALQNADSIGHWPGDVTEVEDEEREMTPYLATGLAEGFEGGTEEEVIRAWQFLHDTGLAYTLQGWFGRAAQDLIARGVITE